MLEHTNDDPSLPFGDGDASITATDPLEQLRELAAAAAEDSELKAQLYRKRESDRNYAYVITYRLADFDLEKVRRAHGGGDYQVRLRGPSAEMHAAKRSGKTTFTFRIEDSADPPAASGDALVQIIHKLNELERRVERAPAPVAAAGVSPFELMVQMSTAAATQMQTMLAVIAPLLQRPDPAPAAAAPSASELFEVFERGMRMGRRMSGGGPSAIERALDVFGAPIARVLTQYADNPAAAGQEVTAAALPGGETVAQQPQNPLQNIGPFVPLIVRGAESGLDPFAAASTIESMARPTFDWLVQMIELNGQEPLLNGILQTYPQLAVHREWLNDVLTELVSEDDVSEDRQE